MGGEGGGNGCPATSLLGLSAVSVGVFYFLCESPIENVI